MSGSRLRLTIGPHDLSAHLEVEAAPKSCEALLSLLPMRRSLLHARWSGECGWAPLGPVPFGLAPEAAIHRPEPGQILLYVGEISEPELLVPYGVAAFACKDGPLWGNHVITVEGGADVLAQIGQDLLWRGAQPIEIALA
jgi:Protein of unknown function (DUF3830)